MAAGASIQCGRGCVCMKAPASLSSLGGKKGTRDIKQLKYAVRVPRLAPFFPRRFQPMTVCCHLIIDDPPDTSLTGAHGLAVERLRGQLTEQPPVSRGEVPGVAEAPALGDFVHGRHV